MPTFSVTATDAQGKSQVITIYAATKEEALQKAALIKTENGSLSPTSATLIDTPQQPSSAVGWIIGGVVAFPLMIILTIITNEPTYGGSVHIPWWVNVIGMVVFFGIAQTINRSQRYKLQNTSIITPVIQKESKTIKDNQTILLEDTAKHGKRIAGQIENDIFKVTRQEIYNIMKRPHAFDNVLVGSEVGVGLMNPSKWFLVLTKGQAVAFDQEISQIWSIKPEGVTEKNIQSVDGRTENVPFEKICILAWKSYTWEEFCETIDSQDKKNPNKLPARWSLLIWSMKTGKDPSHWLNFKLPYDSIKEGIRQLCASSEDLKNVVKICGPKNIAKWVAKFSPEDIKAINMLLSTESRSISNSYFKLGIALIFAGVLFSFLGISFMNSNNISGHLIDIRDSEDILFFLFCMSPTIIFISLGIGFILYSRHMSKYAQKFCQNTGEN